jgi:hypothetical protein
VQAALGGLLLASGLDGHGWVEIVLGGAMILLAVVDDGAESKYRPPAKSNTERLLRYFGLSKH